MHMCAAHHPDGLLSFTRDEVNSTSPLRVATQSKLILLDLFASEIAAAALVALPSYPRDNAARSRDSSHFRLADEMARR